MLWIWLWYSLASTEVSIVLIDWSVQFGELWESYCRVTRNWCCFTAFLTVFVASEMCFEGLQKFDVHLIVHSVTLDGI
jgi:hypothetical protein